MKESEKALAKMRESILDQIIGSDEVMLHEDIVKIVSMALDELPDDVEILNGDLVTILSNVAFTITMYKQNTAQLIDDAETLTKE